MKLCRHGPSGQERPGLIDAQGRLRDLSAHVGDLDGCALSDAALARLAALPPDSLPLLPPDTRLGPPVAGVGKYLAIGLNYRDHAAEAGLPIPSEPIVFMKATSCLSGPNDDIVKPPHATQLDWELELAVVIGRRVSHVPLGQALDHVAGYCIAHDVSERAFQFQSSQWDKGKGCDSFGPLGPWLVTRDEIPDPQNLAMTLDVNGQRRQTGHTGQMIFGVAEIVAYCSRYMTLHPGDVICTGTPPGVGMGIKPAPVWLEVGDTVRLWIDGLGEQRQRVVAHPLAG